MVAQNSSNSKEINEKIEAANSEKQKLDKEIIKQVENSDIPSKEKETIIGTLSMYSGPIPTPTLLAGYEAVNKGSSQRIIDNALAESEQRRKLEARRQNSRAKMAWFSLIIVASFAIGALIACVYLVMKGHPYIGSGTGFVALITLLGGVAENVETLSGNDDLTNNKDHNNLN